MVFTTAGGGANQLDTGYEIDNSLRTGGGDNHHLSMIYSSAASNLKTWTFSGWIKLGQAAHFSQNYPNEKYILTSSDAAVSTTGIGYGGYTSGNAGGFHLNDGRSGTYIETTSKFRDPSAWYHLVVRYDSTQGTASDRIFIYVNGESQPLNYSNTGDPEVDLNTEVDFFRAGTNIDATSGSSGNFIHNINSYFNSGYDAINNSFDGYIADFYLINAQSLAPTEFGETNDNGVWVPKKYEGTFNSHSFHLEFKQTGSSADSSGMGADTSGQDNHFKVGVNSTLAATDVTTDTPTNNFCTWNPLDAASNISGRFSEGNMDVDVPGNNVVSGAEANGCLSTIQFSKGKWYFEMKYEYGANGFQDTAGIGLIRTDTGFSIRGSIDTRNFSDNVFYYVDGPKTIDGTHTSYGDAWTQNDIIGVAANLDDDEVYFYKNGTIQNSGTAISKTFGDGFYSIANYHGSSNGGALFRLNTGSPSFSISSGNSDANGYGNFEYAVPSGYYALCTKNLAEYG